MLWPFNHYPGTDYETFNWDWLIGLGKKMEKSLYDLFSDTGALHQMVDKVLKEHPEWVTTIEDGAITLPKINTSLLPLIKNIYVSPEECGAIGDGVTDDTDAWQQAIDDGRLVISSNPNARYLVSDTLRINRNGLHIILNGSTIYSTTPHLFFNFKDTDGYTGYNGIGNITIENGYIEGGSISFIHAKNVYLNDLHFKNCQNNHFLEICASYNYHVKDCSFSGMVFDEANTHEYINIDPCSQNNFPWLTNTNTYDGTINEELFIENCIFSKGVGGYSNGNRAIAVHDLGGFSHNYHKSIWIRDNIFSGFDDATIDVSDMSDVSITDNDIIAPYGIGVRCGVFNCKNIVISHNRFEQAAAGSTARAIVFQTGGCEGVAISNNQYIRNLDAPPPIANYGTYDNVIIGDMEYDKIAMLAEPSTTFTPIFDYKQMTKFGVELGAPGNKNWQKIEIDSFNYRGFAEGEEYRCLIINDSSAQSFATIKFSANNVVTVTPATSITLPRAYWMGT